MTYPFPCLSLDDVPQVHELMPLDALWHEDPQGLLPFSPSPSLPTLADASFSPLAAIHGPNEDGGEGP